MLSNIKENLIGSRTVVTTYPKEGQLEQLRREAANSPEAQQRYQLVKECIDSGMTATGFETHPIDPKAESAAEFLSTCAVAGIIGAVSSYSPWVYIPTGITGLCGVVSTLRKEQWIGVIYQSCIVAGIILGSIALNSAAVESEQ